MDQARILAVEDLSINLFSLQICTSSELVEPSTQPVKCSKTRASECGLEVI